MMLASACSVPAPSLVRGGALPLRRLRPRTLARVVVAAWIGVFGAVPCSVAAPDSPATSGPAPAGVAAQLDRRGDLAAALPLYAARARQTRTTANCLRYARALLRAGRDEEAGHLLAKVCKRPDPTGRGDSSAVCASGLLTDGFPALALPFARRAFTEAPSDLRLGLLLVRALSAAGDAAGARAVMARIGQRAGVAPVGVRLEMARWQIIAGDQKAGLAALANGDGGILNRMFRDSIRSNVLVLGCRWAAAAALLGAAEREAPPGLGSDRRVARAWRNAQRELRAVELRRALSLWQLGRRPAALDDAAKAEASDEEYVRSAAVLLRTAGDLNAGRRGDAVRRLRRLAGHDVRFAHGVAHLLRARAAGRSADAPWSEIEAVLGAEDRSVQLVTVPLFEILRDAERPVVAAVPARSGGKARR
jgi:tetratricopeptide (TPR) repeat protein